MKFLYLVLWFIPFLVIAGAFGALMAKILPSPIDLIFSGCGGLIIGWGGMMFAIVKSRILDYLKEKI